MWQILSNVEKISSGENPALLHPKKVNFMIGSKELAVLRGNGQMYGFCKEVELSRGGCGTNRATQPSSVIKSLTKHTELDAQVWTRVLGLQGHKVEERHTAKLTLGHTCSYIVDKVQLFLF